MNDSKSKNPSANSSQYESADLFLCAFFRARGISLLSIRRSGNKVFFRFAGDINFGQQVEEYFGDGPVGILSVKSALRDLRALIRGDIELGAGNG